MNNSIENPKRVSLEEMRNIINSRDFPMEYIPKGWGNEEIFFDDRNGELLQCETVKLLRFEKGKKCSLHYHINKEEIFYMCLGSLDLIVDWDKKYYISTLKQGDKIIISPYVLHQMIGLEENNILIEVSTLDLPHDSYRVIKGD